jgi:hypothetical protein
MAETKLFDNLFKVIKANSGPLYGTSAFTEILDLQIPRGYCARIRKVIAQYRGHKAENQADVEWGITCALVADPDDETSTTIPTFEVDHDVICDFRWDSSLMIATTGMTHINQLRQVIDFDETLDVVTVRNLRFNTYEDGLADADPKPQVDMEVYFTYEKISMDLYAKLLGIS